MTKLTQTQRDVLIKLEDDLIRANLKLQAMQKEFDQMENGFWNEMVDALDEANNKMEAVLDK